MKKLVLTFVAVFLFLGPLTALAAETTPPLTTSVPIASTKPIEGKINVEPLPKDSFVCPMMPGAGSGNVYFEKRIMPFDGSPNTENGKFFKFRFNHNQSNCCQGPRIFRWIGMGIKFIAFLLFWILLIVLMVVFIRWLLKPHHHHFSSCCQSNSGALDILNNRYAKGEITSEQYEEMKAKLTQ
jgi:uncharacterized membrane protein